MFLHHYTGFPHYTVVMRRFGERTKRSSALIVAYYLYFLLLLLYSDGVQPVFSLNRREK